MTRKRARLHQQRGQRRKSGAQSMRSTERAPRPSGPLISREELKIRSKIPEDALTYSLQTRLLPNAERVPHPGRKRPGAVYGFRESLIDSAFLIRGVREAGGSYEQAALRLLINRTPSPSVKWVRRALILVVSAWLGTSARRAQRLASDPRNTAERIARRIDRLPLQAEAAYQFAGTHDMKKAMAIYKQAMAPYKQIGARAISQAIGVAPREGPQPLSRLSVPSLCDHIERASPDHIWRAYYGALRFLNLGESQLRLVLRQIPGAGHLSEAQLIERLVPLPGLFPATRPIDALLPLLTVVTLIEPTPGDMLSLGTILNMFGPEDAGVFESRGGVLDAPAWTVGSFPDNPDGELPPAWLASSPDERSLHMQ